MSLDVRSAWIDQELPPVRVPGSAGEPMTIETGPGTLYRNTIALRYSQPLWRNRGGQLDRLEYQTARFEVTMTELRTLEQQEAFLLELAQQYVEWARWERIVSIARRQLKVAREQRELVRERLEYNLVEEVDLLRAREAVASAEQNLASARAQRRAQQAALGVLTRLGDLGGYRPAYDLVETVDLPALSDVLREVRDRSRTLQALRQQERQLTERQDGARTRTLPDLSLDVDLALRGGDRDQYTGAWTLDRPDIQVGVLFQQQLGAGTAEADVQILAAQLRQLQFQ